MKKSIRIIGNPVQHAFMIKDVDVDKVVIEKYIVECRNDIESAWADKNDQSMEVILMDKISTITLWARVNAIEIASKNSGKIVKDIITDRAKGGKKVYLSDFVFFNEPGIEDNKRDKEGIHKQITLGG